MRRSGQQTPLVNKSYINYRNNLLEYLLVKANYAVSYPKTRDSTTSPPLVRPSSNYIFAISLLRVLDSSRRLPILGQVQGHTNEFNEDIAHHDREVDTYSSLRVVASNAFFPGLSARSSNEHFGWMRGADMASVANEHFFRVVYEKCGAISSFVSLVCRVERESWLN